MGCSSSQPEEPNYPPPNNPKQGGNEDLDSEEAKKQRRRLSVAPQIANTKSAPNGNNAAAAADNKDDQLLSQVELQAKSNMKHAFTSRKGVVPYNKNKVNQDRFVFKYALGDDSSVSMWGVMDGHGEYGHFVAAFVQEHLPQCLAAEVPNIRAEPQKAIERATKAMCDRLAQTDINCSFSGSTLVYGVRVENTLYIANVGDSRCVMARQGDNGEPVAIGLSIDQKPERPSEKARIEACGGRVEPLPGPPGECGPPRVWLAEADVPGLAMSRSIGDEVSQTVGVISVPEITVHQLQQNDIYAIWASDGVWEFIDNQTAVNLTWKYRQNLNDAAAQLADESNKQWRKEEEVIDDITVVMVQFNESK